MDKKIIYLLLFSFSVIALTYIFSGMVALGSTAELVNKYYASSTNTNISLKIPEYRETDDCQEYNVPEYCIIQEGEALYQKNCYSCHNIDDAGNFDTLSLSVTSGELNYDKIFEIVKNGHKQMPVYGFILSDKEIESLYIFLLNTHTISLNKE